MSWALDSIGLRALACRGWVRSRSTSCQKCAEDVGGRVSSARQRFRDDPSEIVMPVAERGLHQGEGRHRRRIRPHDAGPKEMTVTKAQDI